MKKSAYVVINIIDPYCCVLTFVYFIVCMNIDDDEAVKRSINIRSVVSIIHSYPLLTTNLSILAYAIKH
ncbi:MAG: hypothetical protein DID92_2727743179 [Candidatus Nitrotoga sp. SPKER]|nr:MAG: hypothetical protein DID92_2727743179 [Candidatus Nitrotoga sp. SPKER]